MTSHPARSPPCGAIWAWHEGNIADPFHVRHSEAADFRMVQQAWEVLSDAEKRTEYDLQLKYYRAEQEK